MTDPFDDYLAKKKGAAAAAPAADPFDAYLASKGGGDQQLRLPRAPGPWADDYVYEDPRKAKIRRTTAAGMLPEPTFFDKLKSAATGNTDEPGVVAGAGPRPSPLPTDAENAEFEQLPWYKKGFRAITGDDPGMRASKRMLEHQLANDPGLRGVAQGTELLKDVAMVPFLGKLAQSVQGSAAALPTLGKAAPVIADTAAGMAGAAASDLRQGEGNPVNLARTATSAALPSALMGQGLRAISRIGGAPADAIRDSRTTLGKDIRVLERHGYEPAPVGRATRIEPGTGASPSRDLDVLPTSEGRGTVGTRSAEALKNELATQDTVSRARTKAAQRRIDRPGGEGEREISAEPLIGQAEAEMGSTAAEMHAGIAPGLKKLHRMLSRREEPAAEIFTANPRQQTGRVGGIEETLADPIEIHPANPEYRVRPRVADVEVPELDPNYGVHRRVPYDARPEPGRPASRLGDPVRHPPDKRPMYRDGKLLEQPPTGPEEEVFESLNRRVQSIPADVTAHAGGQEPIRITSVERPGFETSATSVEPGEGIRVGMGDVRGRVGDTPNRVVTARKLNEIRDSLDEAGNVAAREGLKKDELPFARLANSARAQITEHAPETARMNRRAHARMNRVERARERMKDAENTNPEALGMQLAGQGEAGSKVSGARQDRLDALKREFPVSSRMNRRQVERLIDNPRLLLAEERLQIKKLPRIGGGGGDSLNLAAPLIGRGLYPLLRGGQAGAEAAGKFGPGLLGALARARRQDEERRR